MSPPSVVSCFLMMPWDEPYSDCLRNKVTHQAQLARCRGRVKGQETKTCHIHGLVSNVLNQLSLLDKTGAKYLLKTVQGFQYRYKLPSSLPDFSWGLFSLLLSVKTNVATGLT